METTAGDICSNMEKNESVDNYFDSFWKENDLSVEYFVDIVKKARPE